MFNFNDKSTPTELMDELERFIVYWLGPRREEYGEPAETLSKLRLPEPLRRLYAFAGRWPSLTGRDEICEKNGWVSIFSTQDMLLGPNRLRWTNDGKVVFLLENQGVWSLATLAAGDDAPVWIDTVEAGIEKCDRWPKACDSLADFLITYCLQELTLGARFGVWDKELTKRVRSGEPNFTPLWLNGAYALPECSYNFYLMDDDVLVGDFAGSGSDDDCFFGANSETGIARIQASESPIVSAMLSMLFQWTVEVRHDGSGEVGAFMETDSKAKFPPGTFDFQSLRDNLFACRTEGGDSQTTPFVSFMRSGREYEDGMAVPDWELVKQVLKKAIAAATNKGPRFDEFCRKLPFGEDGISEQPGTA